MKKIIGVRFKKPGKIYFFDPQGLVIEKNDDVIVETAMGDEIGKVVIANREIDEEKIVHYKLINDTINSDIFCRFLEEMISKIGKNDIKNYLIIMDKAKCHILKKTKKFYLKNNLKI